MNRVPFHRSWAEIHLKTFAQNLNAIRAKLKPGVELLQVVKADAYGHGAAEIAKVAIQNGASLLGIANVDEALHLYRHGIRVPLLLMGPAAEPEIPLIVEYGFIASVSDVDFAGKLNDAAKQAGKRCPIHIEVDTGMGRSGVMFTEARQAIQQMSTYRHLIFDGIFTHFPTSEIPDDPFCYHQIDRFSQLLDQLRQDNIHFSRIHMANSGGIVFYPSAHFNLVRSGLLSYGHYPGEALKSAISVEPVMTFKTQIVQIKTIPAGETISYSRTYTVKKATPIAVLPVGYGDGYPIQLSNRGEVLVRGQRAPIVGRVTMDMMLVDISHIPQVQVGDEVVLIGQQGNQNIPVEELANATHSINYEVLCAVGRRAPRVYRTDQTVETVAHLKNRPADQVHQLFSTTELNHMLENVLQVRLNEELGSAIYQSLLQVLFGQATTPLDFRTNFRYEITLPPAADPVYPIRTRIEYQKVLNHPSFSIACATDTPSLTRLFELPDCEYRELLPQTGKVLSPDDFRILRVQIDNLQLEAIREEVTPQTKMVTYTHPQLAEKIGQRVEFCIETELDYHQPCVYFPVYLVHPVQGMSLTLRYPASERKEMQAFSFFAGKDKYPHKHDAPGCFRVELPPNEWIFPNSGVLFVWKDDA